MPIRKFENLKIRKIEKSKIKPKPLRKMKTTACYSTSAPFYLCAIYRRRCTLSQWGQIFYEVAVDFFFFALKRISF